MPISPATIARYAPWGNAELAFAVGGSATSVDPATGNVVQTPEVVEYLATLTLQAPNWRPEAGADSTTYACKGRLLSPATLDPRITNGSQAEATVNGYRGRFELVFNLSMDAAHRRDLRQEIEGTFRVVGGPA
jgi:hypothetical protein